MYLWRAILQDNFHYKVAGNLNKEHIDNPTFSRDQNSDFAKTLRKRVNLHFKTNNTSRNANSTMVTKTVIMLALFFVPITFLSTGMVSS
ncbi:MAG: linoleoyl-CoA desaturase, partial [Candidatus Latescibacterota bacterium]